jgi:hypothetical protein
MVSLQVAPFHHPAASVLMRALGVAFGTATSFAARPWRCCRRLCRRRLRRSRPVMQQVASSQAALQTWHLQTVDERVQAKQSTICRQRLHMVALCWDKMPLTSINNVLLKHLSAAGIETKFQRADDLRYDAICPICFVLAEMVISKSLKRYLMLDFSSKTKDPESHQVIKRCLHVSIQPLYLSKSAKLSETKDKQTSIHRSDIYIQHTMSEDFRVTMEITSTQKKTRLGVWSNAKTLSLNPERWFFERNWLYCLRQS